MSLAQANDPARIAAVADAVQAGCSTGAEVGEAIGVDPRTGAYYISAAAHLGILSEHRTLTALGTDIATSEASERTQQMVKLLHGSYYVQDFLNGNLVATCEAEGLNEATIERRQDTVRAWVEFMTNPTDAEQVAVAARSIGAKYFKPPVVNKLCVNCFTFLPLAIPDECEICGNDLTYMQDVDKVKP